MSCSRSKSAWDLQERKNTRQEPRRAHGISHPKPPSAACGFVPGSAARHAPSEIAPPSRSAPAWPENLAAQDGLRCSGVVSAACLLENTGALALQFEDFSFEHTSASHSHQAGSKTQRTCPGGDPSRNPAESLAKNSKALAGLILSDPSSRHQPLISACKFSSVCKCADTSCTYVRCRPRGSCCVPQAPQPF